MVLGIGIDVCDTSRIERMLAARTGARFRARIFTDAEQAYCEGRRRGRGESYAVRFAAKEAAMKALGTGLVVQVCHGILCRIFAHLNGYPKNLWTALGLIGGVWGVTVLVLLPRRGAGPGRIDRLP